MQRHRASLLPAEPPKVERARTDLDPRGAGRDERADRHDRVAPVRLNPELGEVGTAVDERAQVDSDADVDAVTAKIRRIDPEPGLRAGDAPGKRCAALIDDPNRR